MIINKIKCLSVDELIKRWNNAFSIGTLANWRSQGKGPPHVALGRKIYYPLSGIESYEKTIFNKVGNESKSTPISDGSDK